jgi:hypothetical protein
MVLRHQERMGVVTKKCGCGRVHTQEGWKQLPFVGVMHEDCLELRNCPCGSTIALPLPGYVEEEK